MTAIRLLCLTLLLCGCQNGVQTTSGAAYLAAQTGFDASKGTAIDQAVAQAADVEPLLRFPARFGLARVQFGRITPVPPREADAWLAFAQAHADLGSFVPINPLIAEMAAAGSGDVAKTITDRVRLGAARQHVDAVLLYTVNATSKDQVSPLSLLDLTIVGAYLVPSRSVSGDATAAALLIDVRNGYPYGTASAVASADGFVPAVGSGQQTSALRQDAEVAAVGKLVGQVDAMVTKLRTDLQDKELAELRAQAAAAPAASTAPRRKASVKGAAS